MVKRNNKNLTNIISYYSVVIMTGNQFDHKDFTEYEDAVKYAKKVSKNRSSASIHKCLAEVLDNRQHEISSELIEMYMQGKQQD